MSSEILSNTENEDLVKPLVEGLKIPELKKYIFNLTKTNVEVLLEMFSNNNFQKGKIHTALWNNDKALVEYTEALESSDPEIVQKANYNIGIMFAKEDNEVESTKFLNVALNWPNLEIVQMSNLNIWITLKKQNHYDMALEYLNKALTWPSSETRQTTNWLLWSIFFSTDEEKSLKYFEAASVWPNQKSVTKAKESMRILRMIVDYR